MNVMKGLDMDVSDLPKEKRTKCEVWTRVMGYHRPVSEFNPGKQSEHRERVHFVEDKLPDLDKVGSCGQ